MEVLVSCVREKEIYHYATSRMVMANVVYYQNRIYNVHLIRMHVNKIVDQIYKPIIVYDIAVDV